MRTITCNTTNLDAINAVWGLQDIVRTVALSVSVVRGYVLSACHELAHLMRAAAGEKAKPAYATLTGVAGMPGMQEPSSWQCRPCPVGFLGSFRSRSGRVGRG